MKHGTPSQANRGPKNLGRSDTLSALEISFCVRSCGGSVDYATAARAETHKPRLYRFVGQGYAFIRLAPRADSKAINSNV